MINESLVALGIAFIPAFIAYKTARQQSKNELTKLKESHTCEMEKMRIGMKEQALLYEKNAQTDVTLKILDKLFDNPEKIINTITKIENITSNNNKIKYKRK